MTNQDAERCRYLAGFAAGVRWACELATFAELEQLRADATAAYLVSAPWLRGFVDGVVDVCRDIDAPA